MYEDQENVQQMPKYKCTKEVWALKIEKVITEFTPENPAGRYIHTLIPEDKSFGPIVVEDSWCEKHSPMAPGYYVKYKDGYASWSPVQAFEEGYTKI